MSLSPTKVKSLKESGRYGDGDGLYLNIAAGGSKSWVQRIVVEGSRRDVGLGGYPDIGLAKAREWSAENRQRVAEGKSPLSAKDRRDAAIGARKPKVDKPTFRSEALAFHAENAGARWTNRKNITAWLQRAESYLFPAFGDKPIDSITNADVLDVLTPLQTTKGETATRVRVIMRQTFGRAQARGLITRNPAGDGINGGLPPRAPAKHMKALHYSKLSEALSLIDAGDAYLGTKLAIRFMVLSAVRGAEARGARWAEIDLEGATWTIPADRMKMGRPHVVPLSRQALEVLGQAEALSGDCEWVFPGKQLPARPLSDNTFGKLFRDMGVGCNPHGCRSSFRDWTAECSSASWAAVELSLAHSVGSSVERAYFRSNLLDQRRELMQSWGDYLAP